MDELETLEDVDVPDYREDSGFLGRAVQGMKGAAAGLLALTAFASCTSGIEGGPSSTERPGVESLQTETYERWADGFLTGYKVTVEIHHRGGEDSDELHYPPNCEQMNVELDWEIGTREPDQVSYVKVYDEDCDGQIGPKEYGRSYFRGDRDERQRYATDAAFRDRTNENAMYAARNLVLGEEWEDSGEE